MRISDNEIKKLQIGHYAVVSDIVDLGHSIKSREKEADHIKQVTAEVIAMPDREDLIADLKARIEAGNYNPTGDQIAVFVRKESTRKLAIYDSLHGKLERIITLPGIAQGASPAFSPDGKRVAFEGNKNGVVDVFEIDLQTKSIRNVTDDDDFDANPW